MSALDWLFERMAEHREREALIWEGQTRTYGDLLAGVAQQRSRLADIGIGPGEVVWLEGDFTFETCGMLLALIANRSIVVPVSGSSSPSRRSELIELTQARWLLREDGGQLRAERTSREIRSELLIALREAGHPGLVLFSSGSTGTPKAIVHDMSRLLKKYAHRRAAFRTLSFLLIDHIGGMNTLFHTLANGGTLIFPHNRHPLHICACIERYRAELLPTTPSFLNLLIMSEAYKRCDLSSLRIATYGTEAMNASTLAALAGLFPGLEFRQTYGLSELGILRAKSRSSGSLWMKIGGEGVQTRIVDGLLHIRSDSAMLGYLNAPDPFDDEGWFNTQDQALVDGDYVRIIGRASDIVNVGGRKVFPLEVEEVLLQMPEIQDAVVTGRPHALVGSVLEAAVNVRAPFAGLGAGQLKALIRSFCRDRLESYQIPVYVTLQEEPLHSERFKKIRNRRR
ncbi:ANL family adenylate-forming protein [Cohnella cellulosilytica]|uniref:Long-chain fatty acid--CoA ligase n=1 Tax=Cohnella cellulosilytica TaxID=986710 RepID=A0ABW2F8V1_9BACL